MQSLEAHRSQAALESLLDADDAGAALRSLAAKADKGDAEPFERYAGFALRDAGVLRIPETDLRGMRFSRVADGQLVRLLPAPWVKNRELLRIVEDATNRLLGVSSAMANGVGAKTPERGVSKASLQREIYELQGLDYPLWSNPLRGSHVILPTAALLRKDPLAYYCETDWRMLDCVASIAHLCYQSTLLANSNQRVFGVKGPHSGEWDVRTRLSSSLNNLWTSLRTECRFDCDLSRNAATVHFAMPPLESFPTQAVAPDGSGLVPVGDKLPAARIAYCLRLSALIAAMCFGSGRSVEQTFVVGFDENRQPGISCCFDRRGFVYETLPVFDAGVISNPACRFDPEKTMGMLAASHLECNVGGATPCRTALLESARITPGEDGRALPDDMQRLFHAKRVKDIDVSGYLGSGEHIIAEAKEDSRGSRIAAIAALEGLAHELESALEPPEGQPDARPLFCENAVQRAAVILLDEDLSIGADAEAFLSFEEEGPSELPSVYYYRAPSALFHARRALANLYRNAGDLRAAETHADRIIALAPTMAAGYAMKADALANQARRGEAANVLIDGLRCALAKSDQAMLLLNLALLFRRLGKQGESEALLIYAATLSGPHASKALDLVGDFSDGALPQAFALANAGDAASVISELGIALPTDRMRNAIIARAALGLTDAHAPLAAAPYIKLLQAGFPSNRAILGACDSIIHGLKE